MDIPNVARAALMTGLVALAGAAQAQDRTLKLSSGIPPNGVVHDAHKAVADYIAAESDLGVEVFALTLLNLAETGPGVRDGIADMGYVVMPYHLAEYANTNLAADMAMLATSGTPTDAPGLVMSSALAEYVMLECPECVAEFATQNQLFLGGGASTDYNLICARPVRVPADLEGLKVRVGAGVFGRWAENAGAVKISVSGNETYDALAQGVVDCTVTSLAELINFQLFDVVKHVTIGVPGGVFGGIGSVNTNLDTWRGLSDEQRKVLLDAGALATAEVGIGYIRQSREAADQMAGHGIERIEASDDLRAATEEFVIADSAAIAKEFADLYGVSDVEAKMDRIAALIEKWKGLYAGVDVEDVEAVAALIRDNIHARIDVAQYGMN